ncbi:sulfur relay protein TusB/DsrH [Thioflavicoccus mobilis 8321]|uniref:Sulfur relay protein TusB/DsrH n=1 Tax=Thioflavicoccus mobilis 8321 TaxID=765912 RepID=L0GT88_9GAMM|nr:sulfurtransferase complex subunit TusB [Thioflavicoccus mobilis]AGA89022.1 sulfur relay protein TusB/DsrH [Thioflavicoccus mobilis 8321]
MAILHTVNKSPFERNALESCLKFASPGGAVLLIEDGVYGALRDTAVAERVAAAMDKVKLYVLGPDLKARGFSDERIMAGVQVVDYGGFVDLAAEHDKVQAWL